MPRLKVVTADERKELDRLEKKIERAQAFELDAAYALRDIKDRRLYRARFNDFGVYCAVKLGIEKAQGLMMVKAARVMDAIAESEWNGVVPNSVAMAGGLAAGLMGRKGCGQSGAFSDEHKAEVVAAWAECVGDPASFPSHLKLRQVISARRGTAAPKSGTIGLNGWGAYIGCTTAANEAARRIAAVYSPEQIDALIGELLTISRNSRKAAA